jgi:hypothetical protein
VWYNKKRGANADKPFDEVLLGLGRNGLEFEPAELSPEQAKEARILEAVSGRF